MKNYLKNWDFMRIIRLALGIFIIVQGVQTGEWMFILLGSLFSLMPLLNIGCCAAGNCSVSPPQKKKDADDITYEEVK